MAKSKAPLKEWEESIYKMSYDELKEYISAPETCYPDFLELAENRLKKLEEMRDSVIRILTELGWQCGFDEEGDIDFYLSEAGNYSEETESYFNKAEFYISFDERFNYIGIHECGWKVVNINDIEEVERLKHAINQSNLGCGVSTAYFTNEEEQVMTVYSMTNLPYLPDENYLKEFLDRKLCDIFCANKLVDHYLEEE